MKTVYIIIAIIIALVVISQIYLITAKTETQAYRVLKTEDNFEIRLYPSATIATVSMNANSYKELSNPGFKKLAGYIFGGNEDNKTIAMTTPVHMDINDSTAKMSFVMPSEYHKNNLPTPNDSSVQISKSPEEYIAVLQFGGYADDEKIKKYAKRLENDLKLKNIEYFGNFRFLG